MRMLLAAAVALSGALVANAALAQTSGNTQTQACYAQARQQALKGETLTAFMANCAAGQVGPRGASADNSQVCTDKARLLSGEAKVKAMRECAQ